MSEFDKKTAKRVMHTTPHDGPGTLVSEKPVKSPPVGGGGAQIHVGYETFTAFDKCVAMTLKRYEIGT